MTNHEAVLDSTKGQSVDGIVDATVDGTTLAPKALRVDDTGLPRSWHHIKPTDLKKVSHRKEFCKVVTKHDVVFLNKTKKNFVMHHDCKRFLLISLNEILNLIEDELYGAPESSVWLSLGN